jgi:hypothetical protein
MTPRDALERRWVGITIGVLTLLIVAAGLCCLDQDGMDHHAAPMGLCSVAVMISGASLAVVTLLLLGLTPTPGREVFAAVPLAVPKPPPRPIRPS